MYFTFYGLEFNRQLTLQFLTYMSDDVPQRAFFRVPEISKRYFGTNFRELPKTREFARPQKPGKC